MPNPQILLVIAVILLLVGIAIWAYQKLKAAPSDEPEPLAYKPDSTISAGTARVEITSDPIDDAKRLRDYLTENGHTNEAKYLTGVVAKLMEASE